MAAAQDSPEFDDIVGDHGTTEYEEGHIVDHSETDDASSEGDDAITQASDETESVISETDIGEAGITPKKNVSFKVAKAGTKAKETLLAKLETYRTPHYSVLGKSLTCTNIRYFVVMFALIILLRSSVGSYLHMVSHEIGRRYYSSRYEMDFIVGVERIGVVVTLIFSSYYGNKFVKPISILCGAVLCGIGAIISAVPYFMLRERASDREGTVPSYIQAGLCYTGAVHNQTYYSEQCMQHPALSFPEENAGSFSLFCVAHFFIGIGTAFLVPGGIVYTVEAEKSSENPLYIGIILGCYGLGQLIGSLFGYWFVTYPENLSGELAISGWHIGAWWIGFPVFGSLLILLPFTLLVFPRWIREPRWLLYRKYRHQMKLEKWKKREQEARRERRRKKREKLKKERERKKIKEKNKMGSASNTSFKENSNSEPEDTSMTNGTANKLETVKEKGHSERLKDLKEESDIDDDVFLEDEGKSNKNDATGSPEVSKSDETEPTDDGGTVAESNVANALSTNVRTSTEPKDNVVTSDPVSSVERKSLYKKNSQGKQVRISESRGSLERRENGKEQEKDEELSPQQLKRRRSAQKNLERYKLGRRLQDLPKNLKFLLKRPIFLILVLGAALSLYFQTGYYPTLHRYFHVEFQYSYRHSTLIAGIIFGLGILIGTLVSSVVIYKTKMPLKRQFLLSVVIQAITLIMVLILMALGCDVEQGPIHTTEVGLQTSCAPNCDCSLSQLSRVCSRDGSMSYLSPCHAGCNLATVDQENDKNLHYSMCSCVSDGLVTAEWCDTHCPSAPGFIICCLIAVTAQSMSFVTVILVMIQSHPEKLRSLNLGFSMWIIYIIAVVPGVAVYTYFYSSACTLYGPNCHEDEECWSSDVTKYRYVTNGATLAFLAIGLAIMIGGYFVFLKTNKPSKAAGKVDVTSRNSTIPMTQGGKKVDLSDLRTDGASNQGFEKEDAV